MSKRTNVFSLCINIVIAISTIIGCGGLIGNWFHYPYKNFTPDWTDFFKSIGFLSAIYIGAISLLVSVFLVIASIKKKENYRLPKWLSIMKLSCAVLGIMAIFEYFFIDTILLANTEAESIAFRNFLLSYRGGILISIITPILAFGDFIGFAPVKKVSSNESHYSSIPVIVFFLAIFIYPYVLKAQGAGQVAPSYFVFKLLNVNRFNGAEVLCYALFILIFEEFASLALAQTTYSKEITEPIKNETGVLPSNNEDIEKEETADNPKAEEPHEESGEKEERNNENEALPTEEKEETALPQEAVAAPKIVGASPIENKAIGKYEIYPEAGMFKYRLKANNGEILIVSNNYKTREGARAGIETLKKNLSSGTKKIVTDKNGYSQFRIFTSNDIRLVVSGEIYRSVLSAQNALASTERFGMSDKIVDLEEIPASEIREEKIILPDVERSQTGKIELYVDESDKKWRSRLLANNGEILFISAAYSTKTAAINGLKAIKTKVANNGFHIYRDKQNRYQYVLLSDNGLVLLLGETYNTREAAISSANSVRAFLPNSPTIDIVALKKETEKKGTTNSNKPKKKMKKETATKEKDAQ